MNESGEGVKDTFKKLVGNDSRRGGSSVEKSEQNEAPAGNKEVLNPTEYLRDLKKEAALAGKSIILQAMHFERDGTGEDVLDVFNSAQKGVAKEFYLDWFTRMIFGDRIYSVDRLIPPLKHKAFKLMMAKYRLVGALKKAGVDIKWTNPPQGKLTPMFPFTGRDHIKGADIDNGKAFYFGGVNFNLARTTTDFMVKFTGNVAQSLSVAFQDIHEGRIKKDEERILDGHSKLCIDMGTSGQSIILDKSIDMLAQARENIGMMCMLPPDGPVATELRRAHKQRNITPEIITSSKHFDIGDLGVGTAVGAVQTISNVRNFLAGGGFNVVRIPSFVHAKLLIVDRENAYFGSHNLSASGVKAGTKEWGIFTSDAMLVRNPLGFYEACKKK